MSVASPGPRVVKTVVSSPLVLNRSAMSNNCVFVVRLPDVGLITTSAFFPSKKFFSIRYTSQCHTMSNIFC